MSNFKQIVVSTIESKEYRNTGKCKYCAGGFQFNIEKGADGQPHVTSVVADASKWKDTDFEIVIRR